jgi:hypothetical protein
VLKPQHENLKKPADKIWSWTQQSVVGNINFRAIKDMVETNKCFLTEQAIQIDNVKFL